MNLKIISSRCYLSADRQIVFVKSISIISIISIQSISQIKKPCR